MAQETIDQETMDLLTMPPAATARETPAQTKMAETTSARVVVVTSGKGGVGKTTSTAALGAALAQQGEKVVVIDFDVGLRNLDLVMGAERRVVFDLINVIQGDAKLPQALIRDKRLENLSLLPASQTRDKDALTEEGVAGVIARTAREIRLDHLRQPGRHRTRRDAGDAARRRRRHRHQPRSVLGARLRPHHRPARFQDREGGARRADREAPADHPLSRGARRARRDAEDRRRAGNPVASRCSASFRRARKCCAPPTSARR